MTTKVKSDPDIHYTQKLLAVSGNRTICYMSEIIVACSLQKYLESHYTSATLHATVSGCDTLLNCKN